MSDLLSNNNIAYFNTGALGIMTPQTINAVFGWIEYITSVGPISKVAMDAVLNGYFQAGIIPFQKMKYLEIWKGIDELHSTLRISLGDEDCETYLFQNTTEAFRQVFYALTNLGVKIVFVSDIESPFILNMLRGFEKRGIFKVVEVEILEKILKGADSEEIIKTIDNALSEHKHKKKVLCLSHVPSAYDFVIPIKDICAYLKDTHPNVFTLVDGAHSLGHIPFSLPSLKCDIMITCGHKWLKAPPTTGIVCLNNNIISTSLLSVTEPVVFGTCPTALMKPEFPCSTANLANLVGLRVALEQMNLLGIDKIYEKTLYLREHFYKEIRSLGINLPIANISFEKSGICVLPINLLGASDNACINTIVSNLEQKHGIIVSSLGNMDAIRICIDFSHKVSEVTLLAKTLAKELL